MKYAQRIQSKLRHLVQRYTQSRKTARVSQYKSLLETASSTFANYPNLLFTIQAHNCADTASDLLRQFTALKPKNILFFADGCCDTTSTTAQSILIGKNHYVIGCNDVHEIRNYRLSLEFAGFLGCSYILLLQDDDAFDGSFEWLDNGIARFEQDPSLAIIGMRDGLNITAKAPIRADSSFSSAEWWVDTKTTPPKCGLGEYYEYSFSPTKPSEDGSSALYTAVVNRAPQLIRADVFRDLHLFPTILEPYQYDDDYNCLKCWINGYKVLHMPISNRRSLREGGMRLYNNVKPRSRPDFHGRNFNHVLEAVSSNWSSGEIRRLVQQANDEIRRAQ